ncbi:MAG: serine hydrolase domain-containing protein [Pseudolabrys sp.]
MHWMGRQISADTIAGRPHIPRLLKYEAGYILRCPFLFEEGRFQLDDPIEQFIPQLANRRVLRPDAASLDRTEPAVRPITVRHLMSHSSGLSYGLLDPGTFRSTR